MQCAIILSPMHCADEWRCVCEWCGLLVVGGDDLTLCLRLSVAIDAVDVCLHAELLAAQALLRFDGGCDGSACGVHALLPLSDGRLRCGPRLLLDLQLALGCAAHSVTGAANGGEQTQVVGLYLCMTTTHTREGGR